MATFTPGTHFTPGATVSAYRNSRWPQGRADSGTIDAQAVASSSGLVTFTGLTGGIPYVASEPLGGGIFRALSFICEEDPVPTSEFGPEIDALSLGLVPDGTDGSVGLLRAVDQAVSAGGGTILLPASLTSGAKTFTSATALSGIDVPICFRGMGRTATWWNTSSPIEQLTLDSSYCALEHMRISNDVTAGILAGCAVRVRGGVESLSLRSVALRGYDGVHIESAFQCTLEDVRLTSSLRFGCWIENRYRPDSGDHKFTGLNIAGDSTRINTTFLAAASAGATTLRVTSQDRIVPGITLTLTNGAAASELAVVTAVDLATNTLTVVGAANDGTLANSYLAGDSVATVNSGVAGIGYWSGGGLKLANSKIVKYQRAIDLQVTDYTAHVVAGTGAQNTAGQKVVALDNVDGAVSGQDIRLGVGAGTEELRSVSTSSRNADGSGTVTTLNNLTQTHAPGESTRVGVSTSPMNITGNSFENQELNIARFGRRGVEGTFHTILVVGNEGLCGTILAGQAAYLVEDGAYDVFFSANDTQLKTASPQVGIGIHARTTTGRVTIEPNAWKNPAVAVRIALGADVKVHEQDIENGLVSVEDNRSSQGRTSRARHPHYKAISTTNTSSTVTAAAVTVLQNAAARVNVRVVGELVGVGGFAVEHDYHLTDVGGTLTATEIGAGTTAGAGITFSGSVTGGRFVVAIKRTSGADGATRLNAECFVTCDGMVVKVEGV